MRTSHFYCVGDTEARLSQRSRRRRVGLKWAAGTSSLTLELSWLQLHSGGHHVAHRLKPLPERGGEQRLRHLTRCEHAVHAPRGEAEQGEGGHGVDELLLTHSVAVEQHRSGGDESGDRVRASGVAERVLERTSALVPSEEHSRAGEERQVRQDDGGELGRQRA